MWGYMSRLVKMAKHVIFVVQDAIYPLLKDNDLGVEVLSKSSTDLSKLKYDCWIPSMSIPVALNLEKDNISVGEGFIKVKEEEIQKAFDDNYFSSEEQEVIKDVLKDGKNVYTGDVCFEECDYQIASFFEDIWEIMSENDDGDFEEIDGNLSY